MSRESTQAAFDVKPRRLLLRCLGWFGLTTGLLCALVGLRYLLAFGSPVSGLAGIYMVTAFVGQFALLGFVPMLLLIGPVALIVPNRKLVLTLAVLLGAFILSLIVLDTNIFAQYRYHVSRLTVEIFDTSTWVLSGTFFLIFIALQTMIATNVWQRVSSHATLHGTRIAVVLALVWMCGQALHIWGDATAYSPVTSFNRYLPAYYPIKAKRSLAKLGWVDPDVVEQQRLLRRASAGIAGTAGQLRYPINALSCAPVAKLPNILIVLVDALRPDKITAENTPRLARFAQQSQNFSQHFSGGNSSRMGIFSLFYGLPSTYWQSFYELQREPVLMEQLRTRGYQLAAFSSVGFGSPAQIDRTVFAAAAPELLWAPDGSETDKNHAISQQWMRWLENERDTSQPFFGFLYYDPGNAAARTEQLVATDDSVARQLQLYLDGIAAVDTEVDAVLAHVEQHAGEQETLTIIVSDHGYEFDELGMGYVGHASNYGRFQLQSTLLMDWPGKTPQRFGHRSAHQDFPATLLQEVFGCSNPVSDYSSGENLFAARDWDWFIAGSYNSHAIIEPNQLVVTYPGGMIDLLDPNYRPAPALVLDPGRIEQALLEMRRFYQ